jgi:hypothetical protein
MMTRPTKTVLMRLIERDHQNTTIDRLMLQAFEEFGTEREAAHALGITQQSFNVWKYRLGLAERIEHLRLRHRQAEVNTHGPL